MFRFSRLATSISVGLIGAVGGCSTTTGAQHPMPGPRGALMQDSAMPSAGAEQCPGETGMHPMPGPRGQSMVDAAHPGCQIQQEKPKAEGQ